GIAGAFSLEIANRGEAVLKPKPGGRSRANGAVGGGFLQDLLVVIYDDVALQQHVGVHINQTGQTCACAQVNSLLACGCCAGTRRADFSHLGALDHGFDISTWLSRVAINQRSTAQHVIGLWRLVGRRTATARRLGEADASEKKRNETSA